MESIAQDMIDGTCCELCGQYFADPKKEKEVYTHGYPVICHDCWNELNQKEREGYQKATAPTF